ncbi:MAG: hypothetical protein ACQESK_08105 [Bacteroidota bacterium]
MKNSLTLMLMLILISCGTSKLESTKTIFDYVDLGKYGRIELGNDIMKFKSLIMQKNDRLYLKENVFGGAKSIELIVDDSNKISEFIFDYGKNISYESKVSEYLKLGNPKITSNKTVWKDKKTEFSVYKINGNTYSKMQRLK